MPAWGTLFPSLQGGQGEDVQENYRREWRRCSCRSVLRFNPCWVRRELSTTDFYRRAAQRPHGFNPCWVRRELSTPWICLLLVSAGIVRFQSLLGSKRTIDSVIPIASGRRRTVSIPAGFEENYRHARMRPPPTPTPTVSIPAGFEENYRQLRDGPSGPRLRIVSIPAGFEENYRPRDVPLGARRRPGFNPCWVRRELSTTASIGPTSTSPTCFNPCWVRRELSTRDLLYAPGAEIRFQSLLGSKRTIDGPNGGGGTFDSQ